jgi:hypothetical protein
MKSFVKIDENNIVIDSIVIPDVDNGQEYILDLGLNGKWIESFENNYAGIGDYYNESIERFEQIIDYSLESNLTYTEDDINA